MKYSRATSSFTLNDQKLTSIFTRVSALTKCEHKQLEMKNKRCDKIKFVPRCNKDGSFAEVQCLPATRMCWCVDEHGRERNGTRQRKKPTTCQVSGPGNLPSFTTIVWAQKFVLVGGGALKNPFGFRACTHFEQRKSNETYLNEPPRRREILNIQLFRERLSEKMCS